MLISEKHIIEHTYQLDLLLKLAIDLINLKQPKEAKTQLKVCLDKINDLRNLVL